MDAIILAAGDGTRMGSSRPKVLLSINGTTLLEHHINALNALGIKNIYIVTGYKHQDIEKFIKGKGYRNVFTIYNPEWEKGNAYSVIAGEKFLKRPFLLVMGDHYYQLSPLRPLVRMKADFMMVVDSNPGYVDVDEATKVRFEKGRVVEIGKGLKEFDAVDTGIFLLSPSIFPFIKNSIKNGAETWNDVKRLWIEKNPLPLYDINGSLWYDVDTPEDFENLKRIIKEREIIKARDGIISKTLNRRISSWLSQHLVKTRITPNQITIISFVIALASAVFFGLGNRWSLIIGGLLIQFSSIVDGCDGEIARLKGLSSAYGAWLDSVLDRFADAAVITGMAWGAYHQFGWIVWPLAMIALAGSLSVSYTETRYEALFRKPLDRSKEIPAKRDVRLFLFMLGGIFNLIPHVFLIVSTLSFAEVLRRLLLPTAEE